MRFQERFELQTSIRARDNEISITGTEVSSGRPVTVHLLLEGKSAETAELLRNIAGLPPERRQQVLDEGNFDGIPYIVTYPLPADPSLRAWISAPEAQRSTQVLRPAGYKSPEPGEFTRLFQARAFEPLLQARAPSNVSHAPNPPSEPAPQPGEFTALLSSFSPQKEAFKAPVSEPALAPTEKPPAPPANEPGEFTRMMRSPLAPARDVSIPKAPAKSAPGEFTRLVQRDLGLDTGAKPEPVFPRQPTQPPSEFTQMLRKDEPLSNDLFSSAAPIASQLPSDGFATGAFSRPAVSPAPAPVTVPSEFTLMVSPPNIPAAPVAAAAPSITAVPPAKTPPPKRRASYVPLILILTAVVIIAVILIAVFALQR
jgi:hypothetical protein